MPKLNEKRIRYVSIDPSAFLLDPDFISLNLKQRGLYLSILLHLCANNGMLTDNYVHLERILGIRVRDFDKSFACVSHLFTHQRGKITSPLVKCALLRAQRAANVQSAKGISSAKARGYEIRGQSPVEPSEAKRREVKRSEAKRR